MEDYKNKIDQIRGSVNTVLQRIDGDKDSATTPPEVSKELDEKDAIRAKGDLVSYGRALFDEAQAFYKDHFAQTTILRNGFGEPKSYWEYCDRMKTGAHWTVYGRRNDASGKEWKQERVDNQIGSQIRTRKSNILGNWHDIIVNPNINGVNEIFDQERKLNGWSDTIDLLVDAAMTYGDGQLRVILDKSENPDGVIRPKYCDKGSIFRTPYSQSFKKIDGCWYAGEHTMIPHQTVKEYYPDLDTSLLGTPSGDKFLRKMIVKNDTKSYEHTKMVDMIEIFLDDNTLEDIPVNEEDMLKIGEEEQALTQGQFVSIGDEDNDELHLRTHQQALENISSFTPTTPEDAQLQQVTAQMYQDHVQAHLDRLNKETERHLGLRKKYPHGRYICIIGGELADDIPNPYGIEWRRLFLDLKNEKVLGRIDGMGDVEILYQDQKTIDTMMSRIDDASLSVTMPKPYFDISDKENVEDLDNDPTKPMFTNRPPTFAKGSMPDGWVELLELARQNIKERIGVNDVTRGDTQPSGTSNALAVTLLTQNTMLVAGELNKNLDILISELVETLFILYKRFYVEPRQYFIDGEVTMVVVSELLSAKDGRPIEKIQFTVKPFSNFSNKWEQELQLYNDIAMLIDPSTKMPIVPAIGMAITSKLAERHPEFGPGGKFYQIPQAMQIGMAVMQQEQAKAESDAKDMDAVNNKIRSEKVKSMFGENK
jgi:hypothetical protein